MVQTVIFYNGKAYRPAGLRKPEQGELYLTTGGKVVRLDPIIQLEAAEGYRTIVREMDNREMNDTVNMVLKAIGRYL